MPSNPSAGASDDALQSQIQKRLTLNLLIQGAAAHTFLTAHHLVKAELEQLHPGLTHLYDRLAISAHLSYWFGEIPLFYGPPTWFWGTIWRRSHPFYRHRLLSQHGGAMSLASKKYLLDRARVKKVQSWPVLHAVHLHGLMWTAARAERKHQEQLGELACRAVSEIWDIPPERLHPHFTTDVAFGDLHRPRTWVGRFTQAAASGFGGVQRCDGRMEVIAKAVNWPLVAHELVKGTAELVCLHGLNQLEESVYQQVTEEADQIEYETPLLQAGAEVWRRLLAVSPSDRPLAEMLMHLSQLEPQPLEDLMLLVLGDPEQARVHLQRLGE
ncbi:hypothetical protein [Lignipirellula cremea]|uniref:Uncharacterized protein n=1 Tax=Lignipirellula cremea TaxID=2528010 RepID=A0A518DQT1_9BACT|nr:hypothetical protein [Lignipirellula cremea]QDU94195.1 hypothetical protein Pla8534_19830 [Lignipirellula cremea]